MRNKQGFYFIAWLLFSMLVHAEENYLDAVIGESDIVAQVIIISSEVVKLREGGDFMAGCGILRSEEHTSELQSRGHIVCSLLLEKKNNKVGHLLKYIA